MFLKRIELSGFKSFADRTELEFVRGITAVVGPNGSGKSNISDSIRWVLGEQSAKSLRGGKMEDIIFAGSDSRKAVNFGEVSLTLDNTDERLPLDFTEVTVTRRLHRSGESEYFINKQACRLKDITELFMDTGIGKEAYSIIGQGKIEEILSTKSEDRRGIFEEASGIVKYKARKKEAQKKLDDTEQNLLRIHDLISELEDQLEPLREQSEIAQRFRQLKEQLKHREIALYVHQIEQLHQAWSEANEQVSVLEKRELELSTIISGHDAALEQYRLDARRLEDELEQLQAELLHISEEYEKCEGTGQVLKERKRNLEQHVLRLNTAIEAIEERKQANGQEIDETNAKLAEAREHVIALNTQLAEEEARMISLATGLSNDKEEQLKADLLDTLNQLAGRRNEMRYTEQQTENAMRRKERLNEEAEKLIREKKRGETESERLQEVLKQTAEHIEQARQQYASANEETKRLQLTLSEAQTVVSKWEQKINALVSRRETLQEMKDDFDGFMHGVKEVLKARERRRDGRPGGLHGVHGAVAELVKVPGEYEVAVETALGGALQHIVMEDEASAREAIAFLKQRQLGRATFLPLDVIKGRSVAAAERKMMEGLDGFVGIAAELIQYDAKYEHIARNLLGAVIVAETLEQANRIAAKGQYRYRVVTLDGDIVHAGGSMTGGSLHKKNTSLLGRQRQIDELDKEIAGSREQANKLMEKADELKRELEQHIERLDELRSSGEALRIQEQQTAADLSLVRSELKSLDDQLAVISHERAELQAEHDELLAAKERIMLAIAELEAGEARIQDAIRLAESDRKASQSEKDKLQHNVTELKVQVASASKEEQSLQEQLRRLAQDRRLIEEDLQQQAEALAEVERDLQSNSEETVRQIELLNALNLRKQQCAERIDHARADRMERLNHIAEEEAKTKEERAQLNQVAEQLRQTEVKANRLDVELESLLNKLAEEYEMSFELAKQRYAVPQDVPGTQSEVRDLKRQIAALGEVNLGAIDEYERIRERYEFLSTQKADLVEASQTLYQVIKEMDEEMAKRFYTTFEEIRKYFSMVFTRLFGGGRADLILSEPDQPLETGIEIVAQPPGKKLQNLQLLSGGERALTAIGLLFAILHVKPVPFCVLDEVEAALDEANVTRFAEYLREFSQETQFIVVTHRKGTMEEADVLYGVAMEEGGVSKLVSVRLEDDDEPASA